MEKEIGSSGKMTFSFLWHYVLYYIILTLIFGVIFSFIYTKVNIIISSILTVVALFISVFLATKLSTKDIFRSKLLDEENVKKFQRNMLIFFIICILFTTFYNAIVYSVSILRIDGQMLSLGEEIQEQIKSVVEEAKSLQMIITLVVAAIESSGYIVMIPIQRKWIQKENKVEE